MDVLGSEIFGKKDFFGLMKDTVREFFGLRKKHRIFWVLYFLSAQINKNIRP